MVATIGQWHTGPHCLRMYMMRTMMIVMGLQSPSTTKLGSMTQGCMHARAQEVEVLFEDEEEEALVAQDGPLLLQHPGDGDGTEVWGRLVC